MLRLNDVVPHCLFPDKSWIAETEMHTFCDASEEAYAAVIYVHSIYTDGKILIRQVKAANNLAPLKAVSVPKLKLNAVLLGIRLARTVQQAVPSSIHRRYFWTDSSTVRNWIQAPIAYYQVYVSNRIGEIQTITGSEWRFIPGKYNPADAATRSALDGELLPYIWWTGSEFLRQSEEFWPKDLPWMAINQEIRPGRMYLTRSEPGDWDRIKLS